MKTETNLEKYEIEQTILIKELEENKLTLTQTRERCSKLWNLIPITYDVNPVRLNNLMEEKFGNEPEFNKYKRTFKIIV